MTEAAWKNCLGCLSSKQRPPNPIFLLVQDHAGDPLRFVHFRRSSSHCTKGNGGCALPGFTTNIIDCVSTACSTYQCPQKNPLEWHLQLESQNHTGTEEKQQCSLRFLPVHKLYITSMRSCPTALSQRTAFIVAKQNQMVSINETNESSSMSEAYRSKGNGIQRCKSMKSLMHSIGICFGVYLDDQPHLQAIVDTLSTARLYKRKYELFSIIQFTKSAELS